MQTDLDVLVIGGGLSGLAIAHGVQQRGLVVEVLEGAARAGGVIGTCHRDGALYETGANSALDTSPLVDALLETLGIRGERIEANPAAAARFVVRGGKLARLPGSPAALLSTRAFSWHAKLSVMREPFIAPAPSDAEESLAAFVRRRLGAEVLDYAVDPFVSGVYAGDPEALSVAAAFPRLHALEQKHGSLLRGAIRAQWGARQASAPRHRSRSFSFRNGMQTLTDALASSIRRVALHVRADRVERDADGLWTVTGTRDAETIVRRARVVVIAVPSHAAASLAHTLAPDAATALAAIRYAPIASIVTAYRRTDVANPLAGFGFLVPNVERRPILGSLFSSSMFDGRAPSGTVLLTTFVGGVRAPDAAMMDETRLAALVHDELAALVGARNPPQWCAITRWPQAIPQYNLGHRERLQVVERAERALPGLYFRGNYRGGVSVSDCIQSADATADAVAAHLRARNI